MSMTPAHVSSGRDRDRTCALAVGLSATVVSLIFAGAFAPDQFESVSRVSPWLYGPIASGIWGLFSLIAYLFISRGRGRRAPLDSSEGYCCRELAMAPKPDGCSLCANEREKNRLAAATAGFAVTISAWVAVLSFMPGDWLDWLGRAPSWIYCISSIVLWSTSSGAMHLVFRTSRLKSE
jgi:hypothetical protein